MCDVGIDKYAHVDEDADDDKDAVENARKLVHKYLVDSLQRAGKLSTCRVEPVGELQL